MSDKPEDQRKSPVMDDGKKRLPQTVSFSDLNNQERYRRFTISAQPSVGNQANAEFSKKTQKHSGSNQKAEDLQGSDSQRSAEEKVADENASIAARDVKSLNEHISEVASSIIKNQELQEAQREQGKLKPPTPSINVAKSESQSVAKKSKKMLISSPIDPPVPFQEYLTKEDDEKFHILLACTGSVATIKVPLIIDKLFQLYGTSKISIQLVVTKAAIHFLKGLKVRKDVKIWRDEDEWANYNEIHDVKTVTTTTSGKDVIANKKKNPFEKMMLHNELRKWADIMMIAPLSANTLAKIASGISDNLLTSIVRSWGPPSGNSIKKPIIVAPAMNTFMYTHPITSKQLSLLSLPEYGFNIDVVKPVEKVLVCGDIGMGGMCEWNELVDILKRRVNQLRKQKNEKEKDSSSGQESIQALKGNKADDADNRNLEAATAKMNMDTIGGRVKPKSSNAGETYDELEDEDEDDIEDDANDDDDDDDDDTLSESSEDDSDSDREVTSKDMPRDITKEDYRKDSVREKEKLKDMDSPLSSEFVNAAAKPHSILQGNRTHITEKGVSSSTKDKKNTTYLQHAHYIAPLTKDPKEDNELLFEISDDELVNEPNT